MTIPELIEALERADGPDNRLDIAVEIALFDPDVSVKPNAAGTKVVYTTRSGKKSTHWARDHTLSPETRASAIAALRALHKEEP
jgi:hypothetical protein